jgi:hypothetical protein
VPYVKLVQNSSGTVKATCADSRQKRGSGAGQNWNSATGQVTLLLPQPTAKQSATHVTDKP